MVSRTAKLQEDAKVELEAVLGEAFEEDQLPEIVDLLIEYAPDVVTALGPLADVYEKDEEEDEDNG